MRQPNRASQTNADGSEGGGSGGNGDDDGIGVKQKKVISLNKILANTLHFRNFSIFSCQLLGTALEMQ